MITQDSSSDRLAQIEARLARETTLLWNDDNINAEPDMRWLIAEVKRLRDVPLPDLMQLQRVLQGPWVGDSERRLVEAEALVRQRIMALIPEISVKPTTDPEYPGVVISLDGEDLVLFERLPTGSYAAHVWEHKGEDPIYAHIYPRKEEPSDVTGDKGSA